jgi:hypothetical protein
MIDAGMIDGGTTNRGRDRAWWPVSLTPAARMAKPSPVADWLRLPHNPDL